MKDRAIIAGVLITFIALSIAAGKACEQLIGASTHESAHETIESTKQTMREAKVAMRECSKIARQCCDSNSVCIESLKQCRDMVELYEDLLNSAVENGNRCVDDIVKEKLKTREQRSTH